MKVCIRCQEDCSNRPRVRDPQGRYVCKRCLQKAVDQKHGGPADAKPSRQRSTPKPAPVEQPMFEDVDTDFLASYQDQPEGMAMPAQQQSGPMRTCLNCKQPMPADGVVCMQCGYNAQTGRKMKTRTIKTKQPKARKEKVSGGVADAQTAIGTFMIFGLIVVGLVIGSWNSMSVMNLSFKLFFFFTLISGIALVVCAFKDSLLDGVLSLFLWPWLVFWVFFRSGNPGVMALFGIQVMTALGWIAILIRAVMLAMAGEA